MSTYVGKQYDDRTVYYVKKNISSAVSRRALWRCRKDLQSLDQGLKAKSKAVLGTGTARRQKFVSNIMDCPKRRLLLNLGRPHTFSHSIWQIRSSWMQIRLPKNSQCLSELFLGLLRHDEGNMVTIWSLKYGIGTISYETSFNICNHPLLEHRRSTNWQQSKLPNYLITNWWQVSDS